MEVLSQLGGGFATALQPVNLIFRLIGVTLGLVIGVLPGLGGTSGVAILLPISIVVARGDIQGADTTTAVILLCGIYWGALFGGVRMPAARMAHHLYFPRYHAKKPMYAAVAR